MTKKKLLLTTPDLVVLSLLSERPMHGYEINLELERRDVHDWAGVSRPQVYYSLNKLKTLRMVIETSDKAPAAGPDRQAYRIAEAGKQHLSQSLDKVEWAIQRPISPFLTWLALSTHTHKEAVARILEQRQNFLKTELEREKLAYKSFQAEKGVMVIPAKLMVDLTIKQFELELEWLKKVKNTLLK